ncbi:MAG TPA: pantoate--beta-alanine ligase [Bacteroidales bacterium]|nr:pantoate--beta-alanine ligase [Bacteroidales bacterium]
MKVTSRIADLKNHLKEAGIKPVGFVPTMGALHEGHLSLVKYAIHECPVVAVSIFVNPTQFNDKNDLKNYPRNLKKDLDLLSGVLRKDDIVFTPEITEIYPVPDTRQFSFGNLDMVMEAVHRKGHFNGVAQVVSRLFEIVEPDIAYFGIKDFQQVAVIKELVRQTGNKVRIVSCPIVRESDGLAMSSRNMLLEPEIRKKAPLIFRTLTSASEMFRSADVPEIKEFVREKINSETRFYVEYFEIADDMELFTLKTKKEMIPGRKYFGCIAVKAGNIRLIDNLEMETA